MKQPELVAHILNFVEAASPQVEVLMYAPSAPEASYDENGELITTYLTPHETLTQWVQLPDCAYSGMFVGYCIGKGIPTKGITPVDVEIAVTIALTGSTKTMYIGDSNASQVIN